MKHLLLLVLFVFSVNLFSQNSPNTLLPSEIIRTVHPSAYTLNEIGKMKSFDSSFTQKVMQYEKKNGSTEGFSFDFSTYYGYLRKIILGNAGLFLRKYAVMQLPKIYFEGCSIIKQDTTLEHKCLKLLQPKDNIWKINPENSIIFFGNIYTNFAINKYVLKLGKRNSKLNSKQSKKIYDYMIKKGFGYRYAIYKDNPDRFVKANALRNIVEYLNSFKEYDKSNYYYRILKSDYSNIKSDLIQNTLIEYNPEGRLRVGKIVPEFSLPIIDSDKSISPKTLNGKYYLLQFWATWCAPCISEIPKIREIYKRFGKSNFTIVSISLDNSVDILKKYWQKEGDMPWYNIILKKGWDDNVAQYFGIKSIPLIILVSPQGKILANSNSTGTESLEETLESFLNKEK